MPVPPAPFDFTKVKKLAWIAKPKPGEFGQGHPVFLLTMVDDAQYVAKVESRKGPDVVTFSTTVNLLYSIANEVGGGVAGRTMELAEVPAFFAMTHRLDADLDDAPRDYIRKYEAFSIGMKPKTEKAWRTGGGWVSGFTSTKVNQFGNLWIIMDAQAGLKDLKGLTEGENVEIPKVISLLIEMQRDVNLRGLGRIIASDMFVGNHDRFDMATGHIVNSGNVFFVNVEGGYSIRGLDPLDPNGQNNFYQALEANVEEQRNWLGAKLNDENFLRQAASGLLDSVVFALKCKLPTYEKLKFYFSFKAPDKQTVLEGIQQGRAKIREICERMMRSPHRPAGLQSRMAALGWLNIGMFGPYGSTPVLQPPNAPRPLNRFTIGRRGP